METFGGRFSHLFDVDGLRASGAKPAWFGLGFIQLKLEKDARLHFWHPRLLADTSEEELHDHRYRFRSHILVGEIVHEEWFLDPDAEGDHEQVLVSCKPGEEAPPVPVGRGNVRKGSVYTMRAGSEYEFSETGFHRIRATRAVTYLERGPVVKEYANVIRPAGAGSVCPFARSVPEEELWECIADLLGNADMKLAAKSGKGWWQQFQEDTASIPVAPPLDSERSRDGLEKNPGYHLARIPKGEVGEPSKILEETLEFMDAVRQDCAVMALVELSDLQGAISAWLAKRHPTLALSDLQAMASITERAFRNGHR